MIKGVINAFMLIIFPIFAFIMGKELLWIMLNNNIAVEFTAIVMFCYVWSCVAVVGYIIDNLREVKEYNDEYHQLLHQAYMEIYGYDGHPKEIELFSKQFELYSIEDIDNLMNKYFEEVV